MKSIHKVIFGNSQNLKNIEDESVEMVLTSPPYPMIEMWDNVFSKQNKKIKTALEKNDGNRAFELMHEVLDPIWDHVRLSRNNRTPAEPPNYE